MNKYAGLIKSLLKREFILDQNMLGLSRKRRIPVPPFTNYIRISTLDLVAGEIYERGIAGNVAEVGVFKGMFARYINQAFPDRTFYLFDTFEGFHAKDVEVEEKGAFSDGKQDFSATSEKQVLSLMKHPEKFIVKKGWFPESLGGLEDTFCFVSLDADLYKPIYDGLEYFYPRLSKGGYIFIHDYNNKGYEGAKAAVREYAAKMDIPYVPMSDSWGTVIIAK